MGTSGACIKIRTIDESWYGERTQVNYAVQWASFDAVTLGMWYEFKDELLSCADVGVNAHIICRRDLMFLGPANALLKSPIRRRSLFF